MNSKQKILISLSILFQFALPEIIYESGSLKDFIGGTCANCAYDNFISHTSEGIAQNGYNQYAPENLDIQSNGFGNYKIIDNQGTLSYWRDIFESFIDNNFTNTAFLLQDSISTFNYNLIEFNDTTVNKSFFMIRENLNLEYYDSNRVDNIYDDVQGSFDNGWGLYIINPESTNNQVVIELPHPNDDFISPYVGIEMFLQLDAFALLLAGAGREVKWTEQGNYNNDKSLSDPSRNANSPFHVFHEVLSDSLVNLGPHSPIVLHVHSFDENDSHEGFNSIILSGGRDAKYVNLPIRDVSSENLDIINFTNEFPIYENQFNEFGSHPPVAIDQYYQVHYDSMFFYYGENNIYEIPHAYELIGPYTAIQMDYLRNYFNNYSVYEPWVQVELDEMPELFNSLNISIDSIYSNELPVTYNNFSTAIEYYQPFTNSMNNYLNNWNNNEDTTPPITINDLAVDFNGNHYVNLEWSRTDDPNFKSYKIHISPDSSFNESISWDSNDIPAFEDIRTSNIVVSNLNPDSNYYFAIESIDYFNNNSNLSNIINQELVGHTNNIIIEDFEVDSLVLSSYPNHDEDPNDWTLDTINTYLSSSKSIKLYGNTWKTQDIEDIAITENNIWQISSYCEELGEIIGIALHDSINTLFYSFYGTQELDIEEWVTVYQGAFPNNQWNNFQLPISDDWLAYFDYLPLIDKITYINDKDQNNVECVSYFDDLIDITPSIDFSPDVSISYNITDNRRNGTYRNISIEFASNVIDNDSYNFTYNWFFGDGYSSSEVNPNHTYSITDNHIYNVFLQVIDESGNSGYATIPISLEFGESSLPITFNFVGDIMLGRSYDNNGGIIDNYGVEYIFEPTVNYLGGAADYTVANLECPLTATGTPHPTKSVVFKARPENVTGLTYAGIDIVSLANNHTIDYGTEGLINTQNILDENNILHSGAGMNSTEAYEPLYLNSNGLNIAFLASCDRTGQYNNYQPYLHAGYNKPGFAYMTPYYIQQQIQDAEDYSDFIILELHAGSEYSTSPGADYDQIILDNVETNNYLLPNQIIDMVDQFDISDEEEDYNLFLDVPHMWDREIRHFAIDNGADMVIIHHPHIIQGIEVYNNKVIAHSLGNFIFDLSYPETFPSMILETKLDTSGFYDYSVIPIYIDDYIPYRPTGKLAMHILNYIAAKSRELDTYVYTDNINETAHVIMDTTFFNTTNVVNRKNIDFFESDNNWLSIPIPIHDNGNFVSIDSLLGDYEYRLGRELIWFGNMEDEGCSLWNLNSNGENFDDSIFYEGSRSIKHIRSSDANENIITNFEKRLKINDENDYGLFGIIKTDNTYETTIQSRYYSSRTTSISLGTDDIGILNGDNDWTVMYNDINVRNGTNFFDIRLNTEPATEGIATSWFENVGLIEWTDWYNIENYDSLSTPHEYYYLQIKSTSEPDIDYIVYNELNYAELSPTSPEFSIIQNSYTSPTDVDFINESTGHIGWYYWDFGNGQTSIEENPSTTYNEDGIYDVSLTILDYNNNPTTITREQIIILGENLLLGDLNFDDNLNILDIVLLINLILDQLENPPPTLYQLGDLDQNNQVDVIDIVLLVNIILD